MKPLFAETIQSEALKLARVQGHMDSFAQFSQEMEKVEKAIPAISMPIQSIWSRVWPN